MNICQTEINFDLFDQRYNNINVPLTVCTDPYECQTGPFCVSYVWKIIWNQLLLKIKLIALYKQCPTLYSVNPRCYEIFFGLKTDWNILQKLSSFFLLIYYQQKIFLFTRLFLKFLRVLYQGFITFEGEMSNNFSLFVLTFPICLEEGEVLCNGISILLFFKQNSLKLLLFIDV